MMGDGSMYNIGFIQQFDKPTHSHPKASYTDIFPKRIHPTHMAPFCINLTHTEYG